MGAARALRRHAPQVSGRGGTSERYTAVGPQSLWHSFFSRGVVTENRQQPPFAPHKGW